MIKFLVSLIFAFLTFSELSAQIIKLNDIVGGGTNGRVTEDLLGRSLAQNGDLMVVGIIGQDFDKSGLDSIKDAGAVFIFSRNVGGQDNWGLVKKLVGVGLNGRVRDDQFGVSVAIDNDIIVVGAQKQDFNESGLDSIKDAGAAYVFSRNVGGQDNWGLVKKLVGTGLNGRIENDEFGYSVSISEDIIVVGASGQDFDENGSSQSSNAGAAYIFSRNEGGSNNWGFMKKLTGVGANGRKRNDAFGVSVCVSNNTIVAGAWRHGFDSNGLVEKDQSGAAYIFSKDKGGQDNWGFVKKLIGEGVNGSNDGDHFGLSVSIHNENIIVGAPDHDYDADGNNELGGAGAAYIYNKNSGGVDNWGFVKKLSGEGINGRVGSDRFGWAVAITENVAVASAYFQDFNMNGANNVRDAGAVYVFSKNNGGINNWGFSQKLTGGGINGRVLDDQFGFSVAISKNIIAVGVWAQDYDQDGLNPVMNAGKVSVFYVDPSITTITRINDSKMIVVSSSKQNVIINFKEEGTYDIQITDLLGRNLKSKIVTTTSNSIESLSLEGAASGYYIVNIKSNRYYKPKKVFIN